MVVESAADLAGMLDPADHGTAATWTPTGGSAVTVNGILEREFLEAVTDAEVAGVESARPIFTAAAADMPAVAEGDALVGDGVTYTVAGVQPDGTGVVVLVLAEA